MHVFMIAGEASGDFLGSSLMSALKRQLNNNVIFSGIGGQGMEAEGLNSLFPITDLHTMGLFEIIPKIPMLLKRINFTAQKIKELKPDVVITIDVPDFSKRVAKKLNDTAIPLIHYVAPSVWAWRPGRAEKIAKIYDHLLTLLPFEPPYFEKHGLPTHFVGHPILESGADKADGDAFRKLYQIKDDEKLLCVLPGSRKGEILRHLPVFMATIDRLKLVIPDLKIVIPTISVVEQQIEEMVVNWKTKPIITVTDRYAAMNAANAALVASGTVTLEVAMAKVPMVVAYKVNSLTASVVKKLIKIDFFSILNLLGKKQVIPEFIQEKCMAELLAPALEELLMSDKGEKQVKSFQQILGLLSPTQKYPSQYAAQMVLDIVKKSHGGKEWPKFQN